MAPGQRLKVMGLTLALAGSALAVTLVRSPRVQAQEEDDDRDSNDPRIEQGFDIAPVPLNLDGKNRKLVGLGSYIVNAQADCNGCHSAGPETEFLPGGNPYFGQKPTMINPATYLGGGRDFGQISGPPSPHIISRNLSPSKQTGLPEGDHTFAQFLKIIRHGKDFDHLHPNCSDSVTENCFPPFPPFDGNLLQIMPWPIYRNMTEHDIRAIYEYLKAIPCIQGNYPGPAGPEAGIPPEPADRCG